MKHPDLTIAYSIGRKLAAFVLITAVAIGAFATLGDERKNKSSVSKKPLLSNKATTKPGVFSLKSGYNYRGNQVINLSAEKNYIRLNTVVTMQKGNTTYTVPLKKRILVDTRVKLGVANK
ncbi:MAG TPA: hypothetical protein PLU37_06795 [Chitinophagaceae bacterium]|nr:hypothetical protein [Chitinophagaceae bacterium]MCB9056875.1 hypothetical protein [Chitinophagales bacterium]HPG11219.1 hypothetical protein [Chitinophagaceae bacterium]HRX92948.1 hypothetical protein [Chitinophagaceae bacterium]